MTMKDETRGGPTGNYKAVHRVTEGDHQRAEARGWALLPHRNLLVSWLNSELQGEESLKRLVAQLVSFPTTWLTPRQRQRKTMTSQEKRVKQHPALWILQYPPFK